MKISKLKSDLNKADQSLNYTEAFYEKDEILQKHFKDKILSIKSKKEKLEEQIIENKVRITQMNNFNDEVLKILKQLDNNVKKYVQEVAVFREEITKERLDLLKEIANKDQDLAKQKEKLSIKEKENLSLRKENAKLLIQLELLEKNQQSSSHKNEKSLKTTYEDTLIADRPTKLEKSYNSLSHEKQTKETLKNKPEVKTKTQSTEKALENKKNFVNTSESS